MDAMHSGNSSTYEERTLKKVCFFLYLFDEILQCVLVPSLEARSEPEGHSVTMLNRCLSIDTIISCSSYKCVLFNVNHTPSYYSTYVLHSCAKTSTNNTLKCMFQLTIIRTTIVVSSNTKHIYDKCSSYQETNNNFAISVVYSNFYHILYFENISFDQIDTTRK